MRISSILLCLLIVSCAKTKQDQGEQLYATHCARCHTLPKINHLTKNEWALNVLPEMGTRMGIKDSTFDPYKGYTHAEQYERMLSGAYSAVPTITEEDWQDLKKYIIANAPDELPKIEEATYQTLEQFTFKNIAIDSVPGSTISFLDFDEQTKNIVLGDLNGSYKTYDYATEKTQQHFQSRNAITAITNLDSTHYITSVGLLNPSELKEGSLTVRQGESTKTIATELHRPVHTLVHDFNNDGKNEIIVCEFGHLTGSLSLLKKNDQGIYEKSLLAQSPGATKSIIRDLNNDGRDDIVFLQAQGDETLMVLYQQENLTFSMDKLLRFSPIYGTSWFEMMDVDGDGDEDIITVHGDNADKTQILKPYHGMRIHLNDGNNRFEEAFFYPMYGATRSASGDYDQDGDIDIALVSSFPNYDEEFVKTFVYLENIGEAEFQFQSKTLPQEFDDKWFLIASADVDSDGDLDIILSAFTYNFSPIPEELATKWSSSTTDILVLENTLIQ